MTIRATQSSYRLQGIDNTIISQLFFETQLWMSPLERYTIVTSMSSRRLKAIKVQEGTGRLSVSPSRLPFFHALV